MVPTVPPSFLPNTAPARLLAANLSPNLTLSCTVAEEGRFSWQWTDPGGNPPSAVVLSNVTRTSIATFTNIKGTDSGSENETLTYICQATYSSMVNGIENAATQAIEISPEGMLCVHNIISWSQLKYGLQGAVHTGGESRLNQGQNPHVNGDTFNTYTYKHTYIHTHVYIEDLL